MLQLYAEIGDLIPTETTEDCKAIAEYGGWYQSISTDGIRHQLHVDHNGYIRDGNARYWIAKEQGYLALPINIFYLFGIQFNTNVPTWDDRYYDIDPHINLKIINIPYTAQRYVGSSEVVE